MAGPLQKTGEEKETAQIKQFAGLVKDFNTATFRFYQEFGMMLDGPYSSGIPNSFIKAKADFNVSFQKLSDFAVSHVPLLIRTMNLSTDSDVKNETKIISSIIENLDKNNSFILSYNSNIGMNVRDVPFLTLWAKTKTREIKLIKFYDAGKQGSEKTFGIAVYPSEEIFNAAMMAPMESVPKKAK